MEAAMPDIILSALFSSFFIVRVIKGPWMGNPQYLAVSIFGSAAAMLVLNSVSPGAADGFILGNGAAFAGAFLGVIAFDAAMGLA
jgi:hypothetical protein